MTFLYTILFATLFVAAFTDFYNNTIPDMLLLVSMIYWCAYNFLILKEYRNTLVHIAVAFFVMLFLIILTLVVNHLMKFKSLGGADIKLYSLIALFAGLWNTLYVILISSVLAGVICIIMKLIATTPKKIPMAPFILASVILISLFELNLL